MLDPQQIVEDALARSTADGCVVIAAEHSETNLRWAGNSLTTNGRMQSRSVTVVSTFESEHGTRAGVVSRAVTTDEELDELVAASERAGRDATPADDAAPLAEPGDAPQSGDWAQPPAQTDVTVFEQFAADLGSAFRSWGAAGRRLFGFAEHQMTSTFLGTSTGRRDRFDQPDGRVEVNGKSADFTLSAWVGAHSEDFSDVDLGAIAAQLDERLDWAVRRVELPAGRYETLLPPSAVADLMIYAYWMINSRDAEEGRNVFAAPGGGTRIGEQLATLPLTLRSDPAEPGLRTAPFQLVTASNGATQSVFDSGFPVTAVDWIRAGELTDLARTRAWAQRTGERARPVVDNLVLEQPGATATLDDLVAGTERGLLLTCLWYIREVDPQTLLLTGLTRDGVYLVENGAVQGAVNNFRFNESPIDLLRRAAEAGRTERTLSREWSDFFRRTAMPSLRVPDFNMSTVSPAS
jgi:predicted Zn-dependent protease